MYVGSFTQKDGGRGEGLSVYQRDPKSQTWTLIQLLKDFADPSFLILDRARRHLYSAHGDGTQVTAYRVDEGTGRLSVLNRQPTGGTNGVHLAIDGTDRFLALANYATGSLALFPVNQDGSLGAIADLATTKGEPGPHRTQQESSHPHDCPFDRTGRYIVVPDMGLDRIFLYRLDTARGKLTPGDPPHVVARAGAAPRHVAFHPTRPFAYVINELDSTIATYEFEPDKRVLKPLQILPTTPSTYTGNNTGRGSGGRAVRPVRVRIEPRPQQHRDLCDRRQDRPVEQHRVGTNEGQHAAIFRARSVRRPALRCKSRHRHDRRVRRQSGH